MDLWLFVPPETCLATAACRFLRATLPTRGGFFEQLDAEEERAAAPRADKAIVFGARQAVAKASAKGLLTASEFAMLDELLGDLATERDLRTVEIHLAVRVRSSGVSL